jgi:hypothetical protein
MRGDRKRLLFFLILAINISLVLKGNVIVNPSASAASGSDPVTLLEANVLWERTYGGAGDDRAFYAATDGDGFVVVGSSTSFEQGKTTAWVLRLDHDGSMLWNRTFLEGAGSEFRYFLGLDDGFLLVGNVFLPSGDTDGYAVKIDAEGTMMWNVSLGGEKVDKLFSALKTQDGFVLVGLSFSFGSESDVWVVKMDFNGGIVWNKTFGGSMDDAGSAITLIEDNNFVVAGYTDSMGNGDYDFLLLKIDASGSLLWNKTFGGTQSDKAYAVAEAPSGCVAVGDTRSKGEGDSDAWIIKVDLNGNLLWDKTAGGTGFDMPKCITVSNYAGYLIGGFTFSFGNGERDFWLFKVDDSGTIPWSCTVGRSAFEEAYAVLEVAENEFVMAGWTNSIGLGSYDYYVVKISITNGDGWLSVYQLIALALVGAVIVLVVLFFLTRRRINRKMSEQTVNAALKHNVYWAWL